MHIAVRYSHATEIICLQAFDTNFQRIALIKRERLFPKRQWEDLPHELEPFTGISDSALYLEDDPSVTPSELLELSTRQEPPIDGVDGELRLLSAKIVDEDNQSGEHEEEFVTESDTDASADSDSNASDGSEAAVENQPSVLFENMFGSNKIL